MLTSVHTSAVDWAVFQLKWRWHKLEDFFAEPELGLVLCCRRASNREALVGLARAGHEKARVSLLGMARFLTDIGDPLPYWLQKYVVWAAAQGARRARGRDPLMNAVRDHVIWQAVNFVAKDLKLRLTRNTATSSADSACSVVAEALARLGHHMSEANVMAIWRQVRKDDLLYRMHKRRQKLLLHRGV